MSDAPETVEFPAQGLDPAESLRQELEERTDQLARSKAEFANYQKRAKLQADLDRAYAVGGLAGDLLPVLDNFERALDAAKGVEAARPIVAGLELVHKQLLASLAKHGVEPIVALGEPFDPNRHEALIQQPHAHMPEGTVVAELSRGYRIGDRVLRPAKVAVSVAV